MTMSTTNRVAPTVTGDAVSWNSGHFDHDLGFVYPRSDSVLHRLCHVYSGIKGANRFVFTTVSSLEL